MKIIIIIGMLFLLISCKSNNALLDEQKIYNDMITKLKNSTSDNFLTNLPFDINIYINKIIDNEVMYKVIIDNPKENINNILALVIHDYPTSDIFPNIGIFDDKVHLIPNYINIDNNYVKGINLIGYIPYTNDIDSFNAEFKVIIEFENQLGKRKTIYYRYQN